MRFQATIIAFAASLAFAGAQEINLADVPQCAIPCFIAALPNSGCQVNDIACQCTTGKDAIQSSLEGCAPQRCSESEVAALIPAVQKICAAAGVTVSELPAAASSAAAAVSSAASAIASGATGSAAGSASPTASAPAEQSVAAGAVNVVGFGAVAMGVAAAFL